MKVLLVEDENQLAQFIKKGLSSEGYEIDVVYDGMVAQSFILKKSYQIIILDVNLPGMNGFELCKFIKSNYPNNPVLMLTALDSIDDKVKGFEAGADDYLAKPFDFKELLLRIKALGKRYSNVSQTNVILRADNLELDSESKTVKRNGKRIELTHREFTLLEYLLRNKGRIISRTIIAEQVWDINFDSNTNLIDVYINYLRKKIDKEFEHKLLHTVVGMGYVIRD